MQRPYSVRGHLVSKAGYLMSKAQRGMGDCDGDRLAGIPQGE
jgi:hypothetical protein